jgi:methylase of polypeptide subunit release factors
MKGRLHATPLKNPKRILDIGTGTGIWAIEMADLHPTCQVIGTDLRYLPLPVFPIPIAQY